LSFIEIFLGWPFYVFFLGSFVEGLTGSFGTVTGLSLVYIVDSTDNNTRSIRLGVLQLCLVFAAMASFLIGGIWLKHSGQFYNSR
jgi:MFS family permease